MKGKSMPMTPFTPMLSVSKLGEEETPNQSPPPEHQVVDFKYTESQRLSFVTPIQEQRSSIYSNQQHDRQSISNMDVETLKELIHEQRLRDAEVRSNTRKVQEQKRQLENESKKLEKQLAQLEKQHKTDCRYLDQQCELQSKLELEIMALDQVPQTSKLSALKGEQNNLNSLQKSLFDNQKKSSQTLSQLQSIENQALAGFCAREEINEAVLSLVEIIQEQIARKDGEIKVVTSCLQSEEKSLNNEIETIKKRQQLMMRKRVEQQEQLADLENGTIQLRKENKIRDALKKSGIEYS